MFEALGRWSRPGFLLAGIGLLFGCAATILLELLGPGPVIWALPVLAVAFALVGGAGAFLGLHAHLEPYAPRIAATSALLALLTLGASLVAIATGLGAVARGELPAVPPAWVGPT